MLVWLSWSTLTVIANLAFFRHVIGQTSLPRDTNSQPRDHSRVEVETSLGRVAGRRERVLDSDVDIFLGIPFAKPPVGSLRFKRPVPVDPWSDAINATNLPPSCHQEIDKSFDRFEGVEMWNANTEMSEDCLYLNVWSPSRRRDHPRAVMIWIYGGAFVSGTSTLSIYDARLLTTQGDVIVVSMQYRVGVLGFLYLGQEAPGNAGLLDQHLAIRWVYDNIEAFGGDRDRITLFGESAGAASTNFHLLSPLSQPLIKSSIMQSGAALTKIISNETALARTRALAERVGCTPDGVLFEGVLQCLMVLSAEELTRKQWVNSHDWLSVVSPIVDGYFITEHPHDYLKNKDSKKASILLGVNEDEGNFFLVYLFPELFNLSGPGLELSEEEYEAAVSVAFNGFNPALRKLLAFQYETPRVFFRDALDDLYGDAHFKCPVISLAHYYSEMNQDVYLYNFVHRTSANPWPQWLGVMHGYEIDHVFGLPLNQSLSYTRHEQELSRQMIEYWTNFAKSGNPNMNENNQRTTTITWPLFNNDTQLHLVLDVYPIASGSHGLRAQQCKFWREVMPGLEQVIETSSSAIISSASPAMRISAICLMLLLPINLSL